MSLAVQRRRGTTADHATFTGAVGELTVDTDKKTVVVHDGLTAGGTPLAKEADIPVVPNYNERIVDPFKPGTHSGLIFAYGIGIARADNVVTRVAAGSVTLTDAATNYIEVTSAGVVSANTTGYTAGQIPLFTVITAAGAILSVQDDRSYFNVAVGGSGGFTIGWTPTLITGFSVTTIDKPS